MLPALRARFAPKASFFEALRRGERKELHKTLYEQADRLPGVAGLDRKELAGLREDVAQTLLLMPYRDRSEQPLDALLLAADLVVQAPRLPRGGRAPARASARGRGGE